MKKFLKYKILSIFLILNLISTNFISAFGCKSHDIFAKAENIYSFDESNNITSIKYDDISQIWYFYDEKNQLVRENNLLQNQTIAYSYDPNMNILNKKIYEFTSENLKSKTPKITINYNYNSDNQLVFYDNNTIDYDKFGNPVNYKDGWIFKWKDGKLITASKENTNIEYVYNNNGQRIQKIINGVPISLDFCDNLNQVSQNNILKWYLPESNSEYSFSYNDKNYKYIYNLQGDIIGISDETNTTVASYTYDSWGKLISIVDENGNDVTNNETHIGYINPLRYRCYYYDSETKLYYLNYRYYDPEIGRFLSKDDQEYLQSNGINPYNYNLYAYCMNNPVNMVDYDGHNPYALSVLALTPQVAIPALAVSSAMALVMASNPLLGKTIKSMVDSAIAWSINSCQYTGDIILANFNKLGKKLADAIGNLAKEYIKYIRDNNNSTVEQILKTKKGSIKNAPLPPGGPSWDGILKLTLGEIVRRAKDNQIGYKELAKLLKDSRFNR